MTILVRMVIHLMCMLSHSNTHRNPVTILLEQRYAC